MKRKPESQEDWFRKRYPDASARRKADEAVDDLDVASTMIEFIDTWIAAYKKASKGASS